MQNAFFKLFRFDFDRCSLREIGGKTHTFWFDWGPAGEPVVVGVRSLAQKPLPYKVKGVFEVIVFCLRKSVLLDVDVFCIRWLLFRFASIFRKKKKKKELIIGRSGN